jgi:hypothetical protein
VKILRVVQRRANFLDKGFNVCGAEFGLSVIIGVHLYLPFVLRSCPQTHLFLPVQHLSHRALVM